MSLHGRFDQSESVCAARPALCISSAVHICACNPMHPATCALANLPSRPPVVRYCARRWPLLAGTEAASALSSQHGVMKANRVYDRR